MSLSAVHIPTDVNRLVSSLDITDCATSLAEFLSPLFIDGHMAQVARHPVSGEVIFRSDRRYFFDDDHGGQQINPLAIGATNNANIVDEEGKVIMTSQQYWRNAGFFDLSYELSDRMLTTLSRILQETLNSYQQWYKAMDSDYLIDFADDIMLARMAGCESEYVDAMNDSGHVVDTRGFYQANIFGESRSPSQPMYRFGEITAEMLVKRIQDSKRNNTTPSLPMSEDSQMSRVLAAKKKRLIITDDDDAAASDDLAGQKASEGVVVDTVGLRGIITPSELNRSAYNHHVSSYGGDSSRILNAYVNNKELAYSLEEIAMKCQRQLRSEFPSIKSLSNRSESPGFGWDVYHCRPGNKNTIEIHHVHDLRIYEWELIREKGYKEASNQLVGVRL